MSLNLSVAIPTTEEDIIIQKNYPYYNRVKSVFQNDNMHAWNTSIYEVWNGYQIFQDLSYRIKELIADMNCSEYYGDFSKKTQDELQAEKDRIVEGVQILSRIDYAKCLELLHDLTILLDAGERYVNKRLDNGASQRKGD